jgi:hypothetical protein
MLSADFRQVFLPYCLNRIEGNKYVVLNRRYHPVGFLARDGEGLEKLPVEVELPEMTPELAASLSWKRDPSMDKIYLYNDGSSPKKDAEMLLMYVERLKLMMRLTVRR